MTLPLASQGADELQPPADSGTHAGTATSSTTAAANLSLAAKVPRGGAWFTFQARGGDVFLRFKSAASTAGTTNGNASNGVKVGDGTTFQAWITPATAFVDHIASASCSLFWWQSSPNYAGRTP